MSAPATMRAAVVDDAGELRIERRPVPTLGAGELLVRVAASGICSGDVMSWYIRRKAPLVLGHEPAGTVAAIGEGASARDEGGRPFAVGDRVFVHHHAPCFACRSCARGDFVQCATWRSTKIDPGGIAEYFRVARENQRDTLRLPDGVDFRDAALIEPLGCVVKSLRRSGVRPGESFYVIGLGVMGLMHAVAAKALGAKVFGSDFLEARRVQARACGACAFHPDDVQSVLGEGSDVTICGPGTASALRAAMAATAPGGTTVMFTPLEPGTPLEVDAERLYFGDLRLVASYSCGPDDTRAALHLIESGVVSAEKLGATFVELDETPQAYADLAAARIIKPIVVFPAAGLETVPGRVMEAMADQEMGFEKEIKPLFREGDRRAMLSAFDLWSYDDVSAHADAILARLSDGTMPCDGAWPKERVDVFARWVGDGKPA